MIKLRVFEAKKDCTGCTACMAICPIQCITMKQDEEGFLYPEKGVNCIECKLCESVCPVNKSRKKDSIDYEKKVYAAITKDKEIFEKSSSGGMFSEICNVLKSDNTYIYGAYFDGLEILHGYVDPGEDISKFRKSKYVQSSIGDNFTIIRNQLDEGKRVVFSGTPCQVAGLKAFLKKDYENLFCIDFICHGVGSPKVFKYCLKKMGSENNPVVAYEFRHKVERRGNIERYLCLRIYKDGTEIKEANDMYMRLFLSQLCLRPSCSRNCKFRSSERLSDITIADFNGFEEIFPNIKDNRTYSTLILNGMKGMEVFEEMKSNIEYYMSSIRDIEQYNELYCSSGTENSKRNVFFEDFISDKDIIEKYVKGLDFSWKQKLIRKIPWNLKYYFKKVIRKL